MPESGLDQEVCGCEEQCETCRLPTWSVKLKKLCLSVTLLLFASWALFGYPTCLISQID